MKKSQFKWVVISIFHGLTRTPVSKLICCSTFRAPLLNSFSDFELSVLLAHTRHTFLSIFPDNPKIN